MNNWSNGPNQYRVENQTGCLTCDDKQKKSAFQNCVYQEDRKEQMSLLTSPIQLILSFEQIVGVNRMEK